MADDHPSAEATPRLHQSTALVLLTKSPLHAIMAARDRESGVAELGTAAMQRGNLLDALILGNGPEIVAIEAEDYKTKRAREERDEIAAAGKLPVLARELGEKRKVAEIIRAGLKARGVALAGESQVVVEWEDPDFCVPCAGRIDHLTIRQHWIQIDDLKTTADASPAKLARHCVNYGYDIQHAAYTEAIETTHPDFRGRVQFRFLFVESEPPYAIHIVRFGGTMRSLGRFRWKKACRVWSECMATGEWPGYPSNTQLEAEPWQLTEAMDEGDGIDLV